MSSAPRTGRRGWVIWITGLPGSGKSVLARAAAAELRAIGLPVKVLELDEIRRVVTPAPQYTDAERDIVYRALGHMAVLLAEAGVPVLVDATAHRRVWRDLVRASVPRFAEVQLVCPLEVCQERERHRTGTHAPRDIYQQAGRPGATVPGVDVAYERALARGRDRHGERLRARRDGPDRRACPPARRRRPSGKGHDGWVTSAPLRSARPGHGTSCPAQVPRSGFGELAVRLHDRAAPRDTEEEPR